VALLSGEKGVYDELLGLARNEFLAATDAAVRRG